MSVCQNIRGYLISVPSTPVVEKHNLRLFMVCRMPCASIPASDQVPSVVPAGAGAAVVVVPTADLEAEADADAVVVTSGAAPAGQAAVGATAPDESQALG